MTTGNVLVNDTVRIKVHFVDINSTTQEQVDVNPVSVLVKVYNSNDTEITSTTATSLTSSQYYYDYTPSAAGEFKISFLGTLSDGTLITVDQQLYVSTSSSDYRPTVTLRSTETIYFSADLSPLFIDPEIMLQFFPDAPLLQIGEIVHNYSVEVQELYTTTSSEIQNNALNFTAQEYIKAATACELSRTYNYGSGGDDEMSLRLGDLQITNRTSPRNLVTRANAVTWCQIATALRAEMIAHKVGAKGVVIRNSNANIPNPATVDPLTGTAVYLSETGLYTMGTNGNLTINPDSDHFTNPDRTIKKYD